VVLHRDVVALRVRDSRHRAARRNRNSSARRRHRAGRGSLSPAAISTTDSSPRQTRARSCRSSCHRPACRGSVRGEPGGPRCARARSSSVDTFPDAGLRYRLRMQLWPASGGSGRPRSPGRRERRGRHPAALLSRQGRKAWVNSTQVRVSITTGEAPSRVVTAIRWSPRAAMTSGDQSFRARFGLAAQVCGPRSAEVVGGKVPRRRA
jgi:hypothetical protein